MEMAIVTSFKKSDQEFLEISKQTGIFDGSTACTATIRGSDLFVCNTGDSRAVLCRDGRAVDLSEDHKPNSSSERARIEAAGGTVEAQQAQQGPPGKKKPGRVVHRVRPGGLSLSRAIGDLQGKTRADLGPEEQVICATPEVKTETRSPGHDEFLIIACDGIWDVKSSQEACVFVRRHLANGTPLPTIVEEMMSDCICADPKLTAGIGGDNMTCVIVMLQSPEELANSPAAKNHAKRKSWCPLFCGRRGSP